MSAPAPAAAPARPAVVCAAINGARRTRADHPALPVTPDEIARDAAACLEAGAAMLHVHARDRDGRHTLDPDAWRDVLAALRREVGSRMLIQATSEAAGIYAPPEQMAAIREIRPEAVSIAVRELFPAGCREAEPAAFLEELEERDTQVQWIVYGPEDLARLRALAERGVVPGETASVLFVLGRYAKDQRSAPADVLPFLAALGDDLSASWALCAFGPLEGACCLTAAALGGHCRVGFENNLRLADGSLAPSNAALVDQLVRGLPLVGRTPADAAAARALI